MRKSFVKEQSKWPGDWQFDWAPLVGRVVCFHEKYLRTMVGIEVLIPGFETYTGVWSGHTLNGRLFGGRGWWVPIKFYKPVDPSVVAFYHLTQ